MARRGLDYYFTKSGQRHALEEYGKFASGTAWSVPLKMELYGLARRAFSDDADCAAFEKIYANLASYWQVFRPQGVARCWAAKKTFNVIRAEFAEFKYGTFGLNNFSSCDDQEAVLRSLKSLRGLKPTKGYPTMTVSKFLHFFNPSLFPIYDTAVVGNRVFCRFGSDYDAFCAAAGLDKSADGAAFLHNYLGWASSLITAADTKFMDNFVEWLEDELPPKKFQLLDRSFLGTLCATAFEFTAIGAAIAEGH